MLCLLAFAGCNSYDAQKNKLSVFADIFPIYDFTRSVAKDKINLSMAIPPGAEPHHFEFRTRNIIEIQNLDIFFYCGLVNPKINKLAKTLNNKVLVIDVCLDTKTIHYGDLRFASHKHPSYRTSGIDPHVWLDFDNAVMIAEKIKTALIKVDVKNKKIYTENAEKLKQSISDISNQYNEVLPYCKEKDIIHLGHFSFGYIAKKFNFNYMPVQGFSPVSETSAKEIIKIIKYITKNKTKYVFTDSFFNPKLAETIKRESASEILVLNPMGAIAKKDFSSGKNYSTISRENLDVLSKGMRCRK
ncbi:MAG TPA: zinc ABC transporter substrate-binding protein [Elusimicrobiales bacterium]|nr:zinc ABC transporter substrate-binding protein [Elusimicrobiales bacterium]